MWRAHVHLAGVPKHNAGARFHNVEGLPGLPLAHNALPSIEDARLQRAAQVRPLPRTQGSQQRHLHWQR